MGNLLLVAMFLFFTVPSVLFHEYLLAFLFTIYGINFGFVEFISNYYTGDTVSQQIGHLVFEHKPQGLILIACMLAGWSCWVLHFLFTGVVGTILTILMFLFLFIPSMIYKTYFLGLASMIFILCVGFTDGVSMSLTGQPLLTNLQALFIVHPFQGATMLVCVYLGWICLLLHLGVKFK